jgi:hypothetical protein
MGRAQFASFRVRNFLCDSYGCNLAEHRWLPRIEMHKIRLNQYHAWFSLWLVRRHGARCGQSRETQRWSCLGREYRRGVQDAPCWHPMASDCETRHDPTLLVGRCQIEPAFAGEAAAPVKELLIP